MKTVVYYTSTYFMDISLEMIKVLKDKVNLHVLIEITPPSKNVNILNIGTLPLHKPLCLPEEVLSQKDQAYLLPYLAGTKSVHFIVHTHRTGFSLDTIKIVRTVNKFISRLKPDILHFEAYSLRTVGLFPLFFKVKKRLLAVHDAVLHSGETKFKTRLPRDIFFRIPVYKTYIFYSAFSLSQFNDQANKYKGGRCLIKMKSFSFYNSILDDCENGHEHLLFFGRISKYKGLDILLDAMPEVFKKFSAEKLIIAGGGADESLLNHPVLKQYEKNIIFYNRYIPNDELARLIRKCKMVICPYNDASQSGVLMTTFALAKPAIASDVGAFSESIENDVNGLLLSPGNSTGLAEVINNVLEKKEYLKWEYNMQSGNIVNPWEASVAPLLEIYNN